MNNANKMTWNRRGTLAALLAAASSVVLSQCGERPTPPTEASSPTPAGPRKLTLLGMADYFCPELLVQFEKETGVHVDYKEYDEPDEVQANLRSVNNWADLVVADSFNLFKLKKLKLLLPLDKSLIPNLKNADPMFLGLRCDRDNSVSVPYHWGTTLIAYRKDKLPDPQRSWKLLWDPALRGRVMMLDDSFEPMAVAMILNGTQPNTTDETAYTNAANMLLTQFEEQKVLYGSDAEIKEALATGKVDVAMCYSGDAAALAAEHDNIDYFIPEEGATEWVDCLSIARDTKLVKEAHQFVNFFLRPDVAAANTNYIRYASTNAAAKPLIDAALREDDRIYPKEEIMKRCVLVPQLDADRDSLINRHWYRVKAHISRNSHQPADAAEKTARVDEPSGAAPAEK